jgi:hypothetical protein
MKIRGVEIAGGLAVFGLVVLLAVALWPQGESATVATSESGDSVFATPTSEPTPTATPTATQAPTEAPEPTLEPTATPTAAPAPEPTELAPGDRSGVAVQVVNGGGATGAAGAATTRLEEQSFEPRDSANAAAAVNRTEILHRDGQEIAARAVASALDSSDAELRVPAADDPNWAAFGNDLDVLVVLGPPLP